ncbi:hypothetical protein A4H97_03360 [Niastella yeongjuensis]|uniref:Uncharacterized protein n=1 Tax=Niastella yeongjuensis TaxID=354355 RepID=A0A1V9EXM5_9BACT|nr:hypothetical protein [Niastella yeongjuensis]OQP50877.1 hypothetical protein A4H97_03360 [Niastella yeongjuensis]SEN13532.1 hypothetical protein SAMN05660816_00268 [Niastella yeongjuensis]
MKISQPFNKLTLKEYLFYIENHKKYTDFNTLGLYRSIIENKKLTLGEKIEVREFAHTYFVKFFEFLQLKDPGTYFDVITLGQELTKADESQIWEDIKTSQQKILTQKRIKHRSFGIYSKHDCGRDDCPLNGLMIKKGSFFSYSNMWFHSDKNDYSAKYKSIQRKADRKNAKQIIRKELDVQ